MIMDINKQIKINKTVGRNKILERSKNLFNRLLFDNNYQNDISENIYLELKRIFLHDKEYYISLLYTEKEEKELVSILDTIGIKHSRKDDRIVLNLYDFYIENDLECVYKSCWNEFKI